MDKHLEAAVGPFSDALISGEWGKAFGYLHPLNPLDAVRLVLAAYCRDVATISRGELNSLAYELGVFVEEDDDEPAQGCMNPHEE